MKNFIIVLLFIIKQSENDHCKRCDCHIYIRYIKNRKIDQFKVKEIDHVIAENTVNKIAQCSGEKQDTDTMPEEILKEHYPSEKPTPFGGSLENYHYAFYGQIVSAYMIED